jgi:uncharacterized protein (TIGR02231 family)
MKKFLLFFSIIGLLSISAKADGIQKPIKSDIKEVTVFMSGAQVSRTGSIYLNPGTTEIVFEDLSPYVVATSIQASGKGDFTILSVVHQMDYMKNSIKSKEQLALEDSVEKHQDQLEYFTGLATVYTQEAAMIIANQSLGGANVGVKVQDLKDAADFFLTRLSEIKLKEIELANKIKKVNEKITKETSQLATLSANLNKPSSEIVVTVSAKIAVQATVSVNYMVSTAGWIPSYDLRAIDVNNPISLSYKANVYQSSGENWNDVKLTLSTGNPTQSGSKPILNPWYLSFYTPYNYNYNNTSNAYNYQQPQSKSESAKEDKPVVAGTVAMDALTTASYTQVTENQTNVEFDISLPYTILSDGKQHTVDIQTYSLPAKYEYYCAPKLDRDAFLLARVTGWDQYNLLSGDINLFYEGTYVGKSYLETRTTKDTLDISLGRDKNIAVTRIKLKEFSSTAFVGVNKKEVIAWEINVRNKKKQAIDIVIDDQFPISSDKDIEVERLEMTGAAYNEETGKLTWKFNIQPSESVKKLMFKYSVKYPKNKTVIVN